MTTPPLEELLQLVWTRHLYNPSELKTCDGRTIQILAHGTINPNPGPEISDALIEIDGVRFAGSIAIHTLSSQWHLHGHTTDKAYDECILHLVATNDTTICRVDGSPIPTLILRYPTTLTERYTLLTENGSVNACGRELAQMTSVNRYEILTRLAIERLERKYNDFQLLYEETGHDWQEVFYVMLFRYLNGNINQEAYSKLARIARYADVCRIRENRLAVEALLLGSAGLLDTEHKDIFPDDYTLSLQEEFAHLSRRFAVEPMRRGEWSISKNRPHNHPTTKLAELAALLCTEEFLFSKIINSTSAAEIQKLLTAEASEYWSTHYVPSQSSRRCIKRIGQQMLDILTINFAVPLIFTYGKIHTDDAMQEKAIEILEQIDPEQNALIDRWLTSGLQIENAFFTQALLELTNEYCKKKRCAVCNLGQRLLCSQNKSYL